MLLMKKIEYIATGIIVIGFVFLYTNYKKPTAAPIISTASTSTIPNKVELKIAPFDFQGVQVDTSDWQTYRNEQYGYEFKYSKGWDEINYYGYLTNKYDIERVRKSYIRQKIVGFQSNDKAMSIGIVYKGKGFGYNDLLNEWNQTGQFTNYKFTKFVDGENTIIIQSSHLPPGTPGYEDDMSDVYMWILNKNGEIYAISGNRTEDGGYIPGGLKYFTGLYRTFKTIASTTPAFFTPTGQEVAKYKTVPDNFSWIEEKNDEFGISFNRPSFWEFQSSAGNNGRDYSASFSRPSVINTTDLTDRQKGELNTVLLIAYYPNLGMKGEQLTPEQNLNPDSTSNFSPKNDEVNGFGSYRKTIGDINLIKSITPNNEQVRYTFFTKDKVIIFSSYNTSRAEISVIEQMIASFKLLHTDEEIVTPSNWINYPL